MRLLFISNLYEPYARGGAEVIVKRSIQAAQADGHEVALLTARSWRGGGRLSLRDELAVETGLRTFSFYPLNLFFYGDDYRWPLLARLPWHVLDQCNYHSAWLVRKALQIYKPDAVITHNLMGLGFTIPAEIRRAGCKHVHVLHDIQLAVRRGLMIYGHEHGLAVDGFVARAYQAAVRRQFGSPDVVISPSTYLLDFYEQLGYFSASKRVVLRNPVDESFYTIPTTDAVDSGLTRPMKLIYVGQLVEHKGLRVLMDAYTKLQKQQPGHYTLTIVGDGVMKPELARFAASHDGVYMLGRVANTDLPALYAKQDALVLPTITYENSPSVVFEALAAGIPVCVSEIGGAAEAVQYGKNGSVFKPGDADDLVRVLQAMAAPGHISALKKQARPSVAGLARKMYWRSFTAFLGSDT